METSEFPGVCASVLHERMSTLNDEHASGLKLRAAAMSISVWRRPVSLRTFISQRLAGRTASCGCRWLCLLAFSVT